MLYSETVETSCDMMKGNDLVRFFVDWTKFYTKNVNNAHRMNFNFFFSDCHVVSQLFIFRQCQRTECNRHGSIQQNKIQAHTLVNKRKKGIFLSFVDLLSEIWTYPPTWSKVGNL